MKLYKDRISVKEIMQDVMLKPGTNLNWVGYIQTGGEYHISLENLKHPFVAMLAQPSWYTVSEVERQLITLIILQMGKWALGLSNFPKVSHE